MIGAENAVWLHGADIEILLARILCSVREIWGKEVEAGCAEGKAWRGAFPVGRIWRGEGI